MRRQSFGQAFNAFLQNTANILSQNILNQKELERQALEQEKAQREQASILGQLLGGGYQGKTQPSQQIGAQLPQQEGLSPQRQGFILSRLTPENYDRYKDIQKQNAPQERKPLTNINYSGREIKAFDPNDNKIVSLGENPDYKEQKPEDVWIMDENWGDKVKKLKGYENPNADPKDETTRIKDGKKYTVTDWTAVDKWEKKTNSSNPSESYYDISDASKKMLSEYYKKQQEYKAITNAGFGNRTRDGKEDTPKYKDELVKHNKVYLEAVRNIMPESAKVWYNKLYNQGGDEIDPRDYLLNLKSSFSKGTLGANPDTMDNYDVADFNILIEQFKPIYGFDPREQYGQFLEKLQ